MYKPLKLTLILAPLSLPVAGTVLHESDHPNVIIIITDDQGYGDIGITGNTHVKTPVLDNFARESIRFNQFFVSPVCAPTRSSLMTGRYSLRTGVRDTYNGGAIMAAEEVTIAEMLKESGYRTGMFGKWHLGDNYPFRPGDQGFDESLIHLSGGMGQPGDFTTFFKGDSSYFDPVLWYNGEQKYFKGYCSDIFANEAIHFIEKNYKSPFFCYLAFNAPHEPLQVPQKYYEIYQDIDPEAGFKNDGRPFPNMSEQNKESARKVYAMVSNIDDNIGNLLKKLDELGITENTLVIFMTDNGPQHPRYVAGMRGRKGSVFRGGVRVPFYWRLPSFSGGDKDVDLPAAHIDILPTLSELCSSKMPDDRIIDGKSLLPLIKGENPDVFKERTLFFNWSRRYPELYKNIAVQKGEYKLVGNTEHDSKIENFELYNVIEDPYEQNNILLSNIHIAERLKTEMDELIFELTGSENIKHPPAIIIGSPHENPVILNRNDAGGERGIWRQEEVFGHWKVKITEGHYNLKFKFINPVTAKGIMYLETNSFVINQTNLTTPTDVIEMNNVYFPDTECELTPHYSSEGKNIFPLWVEIKKVSY